MIEQQWKLVPVPATEEMVRAALSRDGAEFDPRAIVVADYLAMLAAAPQPPALGGELEVLRYMFDWARAICCDGPRDWITCIERELPHPDFFKDGQAKNLIELVDRAHIARLQADLTSANADKSAYAQNAVDLRRQLDESRTEVERLGQRIEDEVASHIAVELKAEDRTAALEGLLRKVIDTGDLLSSGTYESMELEATICAALAEGAKS